MYTTSATPNSAKRTSIGYGGKILRGNVRAASVTPSDSGALTTTAPAANAPGAMVASAPATTSPLPCCIGASGRCRIGFWPPFCCVSPVRPGASPEELGIHLRTSYRWCWWLRNVAVSYAMQRRLDGTVEADDLYHTAGNKGQAKQGGKKLLGRRARGRRKKREPGRGHDDTDRPAIIAWGSRQGAVAR
jgi:hypothetical protein